MGKSGSRLNRRVGPCRYWGGIKGGGARPSILLGKNLHGKEGAEKSQLLTDLHFQPRTRRGESLVKGTKPVRENSFKQERDLGFRTRDCDRGKETVVGGGFYVGDVYKKGDGERGHCPKGPGKGRIQTPRLENKGES